MKLIRHLAPSGPAYAALLPDGLAQPLDGDPFSPSGLQPAGLPVTPGPRLAPVLPQISLALA